jgi:Leucine-rich repeat (LRR) protein
MFIDYITTYDILIYSTNNLLYNKFIPLNYSSLSSNHIEEISDSAFSTLSNLKELTLSRNQLTSFPTAAIPRHLELL